MCNLNKKSGNRRIDPCIKLGIESIQLIFDSIGLEIKGCCCGHGKYPITMVVYNPIQKMYFEIFAGRIIKRKKRFYKKDKQGYYYIPEVVENINKKSGNIL